MSDLHAKVMRMLKDRAAQGGVRAGKGVYVDNAENRRLGRVGKPKGSVPVHGKKAAPKKAAPKKAAPKKDAKKKKTEGRCPVYVDNAENRRLGRVGKPKGTAPVHEKKKGGIMAGRSNDWVNYVKQYARMNGLTYGEALAEAGPSYHAQA